MAFSCPYRKACRVRRSAPVRFLVHRIAEPPLGCVRQPLAQGRAAPGVHHKQDAPPGAGMRLRGETVREAHPLHVHRLPDGAVSVKRLDGRDRFAPIIQQKYALQGSQRIGGRKHPATGHIRLTDQQIYIISGIASRKQQDPGQEKEAETK